MTTLQRTGHLLRWELRRSRWWLLAFGGLVLFAAAVALTDQWGGTEILPVLVMGVALFASANIMVADAPLVPTAHWVSKPIDPRELVAAKLILCFGSFVVMPLAVQAAAQLTMGVPIEWVRGGMVVSEMVVRSWLLLAIVIGAASRSARGIISLTLAVLAVLAIGSVLVAQWQTTVVWSATGNLPASVVSAVYSFSLWLPLAIVVWLYWRRPSRGYARLSIVALLGVRVLALVSSALVRRDPSRLETLPGALVLDSVAVADSTHVRMAYHINGQTDSAAMVAEFQSALATVTGTRADTLSLFALIAPNEATPAQPTLDAGVIDPVTGSRRSLRAKMTRAGVVVWKSRVALDEAGKQFSIAVQGARYRRRLLARVPWRYGTLDDRNGRRMELAMDSSMSIPRPVLVIRSASAPLQFAGLPIQSPVDNLEFSIDQSPTRCCVDARLGFGRTDMGGLIVPGIPRMREIAPLEGDLGGVGEGDAHVTIREWQLRDVIVMRATWTLQP